MQLYSKAPFRQAQQIVVPDSVPVFQILEGKFFGVDENGFDRLYEAGAVIAYEEEPNIEMKPLNELAWKAMRKYLDKLDAMGQKKAEKDGVAHTSYRTAFEAAHAPASKRINGGAALLNNFDETPIMQGKKKAGRVSEIDRSANEVASVQMVGKAAVNDSTSI